MEDIILQYVKPELIIVAVVLYLVGLWLKAMTLKDKYIPLVLGVVGVTLCTAYVLATSDYETPKQVLSCIFTAVVQGILTAGLSTYVNQMIKQLTKGE